MSGDISILSMDLCSFHKDELAYIFYAHEILSLRAFREGNEHHYTHTSS